MLNFRHPVRQSEKLWDDFPGSFHPASNCLTHRLAPVHIDIYPVCRGNFALAALGGIRLSREVWMANEGTAFLAILGVLRGWSVFLEAKVGTDSFLSWQIFCQAGLLFLRNSTLLPLPKPPPAAFGQISGDFGTCLWDCIYSFLMWWMQRYAFSWVKFTSTFSSLTGTKSHKYFLRGEKGFQMQSSKCEGIFFCSFSFFGIFKV